MNNPNSIKVGKKIIGVDHAPFIIAEMSGNHNQSLERALKIVDEAARCGAHAIKLQTYKPETMTVEGAFTITDEDSLWKGKELHDLYQEAHTPWEWHEPIFERAKEKGIMVFSTPFDETAVDFLENLNVPAYKIASFENTDWPLLKKVAKTGKPVIMSTGAASLSELDEAVSVLKNNGCSELVLLKCTSTYPASPENTNLVTLPHLKEMFGCLVGLSDHTHGVGVAIASIALGAVVVEKHFTLNRKDGGVDSAFSIEPQELTILVNESLRAYQSLGEISYGVQKSEEKSRVFKRSLIAIKDIEAGETFTEENIKVLRPGFGITPKYLELVIGRTAKNPIIKGAPIQWQDI